jgi:stromal membrane-associated protein
MWGAPAPAPAIPAGQSSFFNTSDVWGSSNAAAANPSQDLFGAFGGSTTSAPPPKKDDAFGDIWGGFK